MRVSGLAAVPLWVGLLVASAPWALAQSIVSGQNQAGNLTAGQTVSYTLAAATTDNLLLRIGATNFVPRIDVYGPGGTLAASAFTASTVNRDAVLYLKPPANGTFTVSVSSYYANGAGSYGLRLVQVPGAFQVPAADDGGALSHGARYVGQLDLGDLDPWSFTANSGDSIQIRLGSTNFVPRLDLYGPDGALVASEFVVSTVNRDTALMMQVTNSGTFVVVASSYYANGSGPYGLNLVRVPGELSITPGDDGGALINGARHSGQLALGDLDAWSFNANAGDRLQIRIGTTNFVPRLDLYGPGGALVSSGFDVSTVSRDAVLMLESTNSGVFTVVASSYYANGSGSFALTLARVPAAYVTSAGDEGGVITNGTRRSGTIELGDLDIWSFAANANDSIQLRVGTLGFVPRIDLYGPDGRMLTNAFSASTVNRDAPLAMQLTNTGTFTAVVSSYYENGSGTYEVSLAKSPGLITISPGDEGGPLSNGTTHQATIDLGDLDAWTFQASAGNSVLLRMGTTGFVPRLDLYGPDGARLASAFVASSVNRDASLSLRVTNSGTFTVVAGSFYANGSGTYDLSYVLAPGDFSVAPGDDGGALTNGLLQAGTLDLGDLDIWKFDATAGASIELRVGTLASLVPRIDLYGPNGALIDSAFTVSSVNRDALLTARLTNSGTHTVVVSSYFANNSGAYTITSAKTGAEVFASPGDEGGNLVNGLVYVGTNVVGDLDVWRFYGTRGDSNLFRIATANFTPWLKLYDPSGALVSEAFTASSVNRTNHLSFNVTNDGFYTLIANSYYLGSSGTYSLKQSRVPPDLVMPTSTIIDEGLTMTVPFSAADPDEPNKPLTFLLQSGPPGLNLNQLGPTNGVLSWATTKITGPSTNTVVVTVSDFVNGKTFTRTNTLVVVVDELNTTPQLTVPTDQTVPESTPLAISAGATDLDFPTNALTYSLIAPPAGMVIDPANGAITWIPTEAQGPFTNVITVVVTDDNPWAINATHLSATNSFRVVVQEMNTAPQLTVPPPQSLGELTPLRVIVSATDSDVPVNPVNFSLLAPPPGMVIDPASGEITWTPSEAQGPSTNLITVVATDDNVQAVNTRQLRTTNSFLVTVRELNTPPRLTLPLTQTINETASLNVTAFASDDDVPANPLSFSLLSHPDGLTIDPATGVINWTPTEAQGPSTNTVEVVATDDNPADQNAQHLRVTNSFTVVVREVNSPPQLLVPGTQTLDELTSLAVSVRATDTDLPTNTFNFALLQAPTGMSINTNTGAITWTPTEAQGPSTNTVEVVVTDDNPADQNAQHLRVTNSFTVVVREVNSPPQLIVPGTQTLDELTSLAVSVRATDTDLPTNTFNFALLQAPTGMSINTNTGAITWTPTEAQGPSTNTVLVTVTDYNPAASNEQRLSVTNSFQVTVNESNSPPVLQPMDDRSTHYGTLFSLQVAASDLDLPTNTLTFSLQTAPTNMVINRTNGFITWTPSLTQLGSNLVIVRVTDNGTPALSATQSFQAFVTGEAARLAIQPLPGGYMQLSLYGDVGVAYELQMSTNLSRWDPLQSLTLPTSPYLFIDPGSAAAPVRLYRARLNQ